MLRHDAQRSAVTGDSLTFPLSPTWQYTASQPPAPAWPDPVKNSNRTDFDYAAHPIIAGDIVYFASSADDTLRALDAKTGKERWRFTADGPLRFAPQVSDGQIFFGGDDGIARCLDAGTGKLIWSFRGGPTSEMILGNGRMISRWPIRTGVLVDQGVLYFVAGMWPTEGVFVYALEAKTGKVIWCNDTSGHVPVRVVGHAVDDSLAGICPQGALLVSADKLIVPMGRSTPATFDRKTGALLKFEPGENNGAGGTFLTLDRDRVYSFANSFYSPTALNSFPLDTLMRDDKLGLKAVQMPTLVVPNAATFYRGRQYSMFERRLAAIVNDKTMTVRFAEGIARAGSTLILGYDGSVAAEDSVGKRAANVRVALAGNDLAVLADVTDRKMSRDAEKPWKGSCFEVFVSTQANAPVGQVMLIPSLGDAPAAGLMTRNDKPVIVPEVRVTTTPTAEGYRLRALIPLTLLNLAEKPAEIGMEFQITTVTDAGRQNRDTLFGSLSPYQNREKYGRFSLGPAAGKARSLASVAPIDALEKVDEVISKLPAMMMGVTDQTEIWRAPVNGKALGLAVANGRLVVSTDKGEITCFSSEKSSNSIINAQVAEEKLSLTPAEKDVIDRLQKASMNRGYALVTGDGAGHFSRALTTVDGLRVITCVERAEAADTLRKKLIDQTSVYGTRLHVVVASGKQPLPFPRYFASAVVVASPQGLPSGAELFRVLRPAGGLLFFPGLGGADLKLAEEIKLSGDKQIVGEHEGLTRTRLTGAWDWDSTGAGDRTVRWPLRPIWFGGTGPAKTHNRKFQAPTLAGANGLFFENAEAWITAVDAYNGAEWWSRAKPMQLRETLPYSSVVAADDKHVYFTMSPKVFRGVARACAVLDAHTGRQVKFFGPWVRGEIVELSVAKTWPLSAEKQGATTLPGVTAPPIGALTMASDAEGLTLTLKSDPAGPNRKTEWRIYLDTRPTAQRYGLFDPGVWCYRVSPNEGRAASWLPGNGESHPPIALTMLPAEKGTAIQMKLRWADLPGGRPSSFGFAAELTQLMTEADYTPIIAGLFADEFTNGINNGWANIVLDKSAIAELEKKPKVIAGKIEGEPAGTTANLEEEPEVLPLAKLNNKWPSLDMRESAGARIHPLTGQMVERIWTRGDGCGGVAYTASGVVSRAANVSFYDFVDDSGLRTFPGIRSSCGNSMLPAMGVWYIANGGSGCECTYSFLSQVAMAPADRRLNEDWAVFAEWKADAPVKQAAINFGAPGDRRSASGILWLSYPRPPRGYVAQSSAPNNAILPPSGVWIGTKSEEATPLPIAVEKFDGATMARINTDRVTITGTSEPWIYGSAMSGVKKVTFTLNAKSALISAAADKPVTIDGKLDDAAWSAKPAVELPTTHSTVAFAHDAENLYIACRRPTAVDRKGDPRKWQPGTATNFHFADTWEVFVSDAKDEKVVHLGTSAGGHLLRGIATGKSAEKGGLIPGVNIAGSATDQDGFVAEFLIPLATLKGQGIDVDSLRVNARIGDHPIAGEAIVRLGAMGMARCQGFVPLGLGKAPEEGTRRFGVRLHFAELAESAAAGKRVFDVKIQGKTVLTDFDIAAAAGGSRTAVVKDFPNVEASREMVIEFVPKGNSEMPMLNGMELSEQKSF